MSKYEQFQRLLHEKPALKDYFEANVFPVLTNALESLLVDIDLRRRRTDSGEEVPPVQPVLFLAQYLMRHNPQT